MLRIPFALIFVFVLCASPAVAQKKKNFSIGAGISLCTLKGVASPRDCHRIDPDSDISVIPDWAFWPQENYELISDIGRGKFGDLFDKLEEFGKSKVWDYIKAWATGDPHVVSFTGQAFDFMSRGEFNYLELGSERETLKVHVRHHATSGTVAVIQGVSIQIGDNLIEIQAKSRKIFINGVRTKLKKRAFLVFHDKELTPPTDSTETPYAEMTGAITKKGNAYFIIDRNRNQVVVQNWGVALDLYVALNSEAHSVLPSVRGVFGSSSGGFRFATGPELPSEISRAQFQVFAAGYALSVLDSNFKLGNREEYEASFPDSFVTVDDLSEKGLGKATELADKLLGVGGNEYVRKSCIFDLGFGGKEFKKSCKANRSAPVSEIKISE